MVKVYEDRCREHGWEISYRTFDGDENARYSTLAKESPRGLRFEFNWIVPESGIGGPLGIPVPSLNDNVSRWAKDGSALSWAELEAEQKTMYAELDELKRDLMRGHRFKYLTDWSR